jgi:hypothetical protein
MPSRKRWSRRAKETWRGQKPEEGSEAELRLIPVTCATRPRVEESLEVEALGCGSRLLVGECPASNDKGAAPSVRREALRGERSPWTGHQPWTWLRDETSLQSRGAEQTVERLRKPEDGT